MIGARSGRAAIVAASIASAAALFGPVLLGAAPAEAHPHVWVTTETTVLYENGTIVGLRHKWSFDDFYTSMALEGLDTNKDGVYDRDELAPLAKVNIDGLKEFDYFTIVKLAGETLKLQAPKDYYLEHAEGPVSQSQATDMTDEEAAKEAAEADARDKAAAAPPQLRAGIYQPVVDLGLWRAVGRRPARRASTRAKPSAPPAPTKVLSLYFTLPLAQPVLADARGSASRSRTRASSSPSSLRPRTRWCSGRARRLSAYRHRDGSGADTAKPASATQPAAGDPPAAATEPNPAADLSRLGDAFSQQFGGGSVASRFGRPTSISCGPRS